MGKVKPDTLETTLKSKPLSKMMVRVWLIPTIEFTITYDSSTVP